jgi:hypothetical protein
MRLNVKGSHTSLNLGGDMGVGFDPEIAIQRLKIGPLFSCQLVRFNSSLGPAKEGSQV